MSLPSRPKVEVRSAKHEGAPVHAPATVRARTLVARWTWAWALVSALHLWPPGWAGQARVAPAPAPSPARAAAGAVAEPTVQATVDLAADNGALPLLWRPSVMISWPDPAALQKLLALPGRLGALRYTMEPMIQDRPREAEFFAELDRQAPLLRQLAERDAQLLVTFTRMPAWLSPSRSTRREPAYGYMEREGLPPASQAQWQSFSERVARRLAREAPGRLWYEGWNEPDATGFWKGTRQALFDTWVSFAQGVRAGDPTAKVGTPCLGTWSTDHPREKPDKPTLPTLQWLLQQAGARGGPGVAPDFLCWHNFGKAPGEEWWGAASLRDWAAAAGLDARMPQVVSEWNLWSTAPQEAEPGRDEARGAAFMTAALHAMERAGVQMQTPAVLQDFKGSGRDDPFHGEFGLLTREPMVEKAAFQVLAMQARLLPRRLSAQVDDAELADVQSLDVLATADGKGALAVLVSRYHGDARGGFVRALGRHGYPAGRGLTVYGERLNAFLDGKRELEPNEVDTRQEQALRSARSVSRASRNPPAQELAVQLMFKGPRVPRAWQWRLYLVDSRNLNPQAAYRQARAQGRSPAQALEAARAVRFEPVRQGQGPLPPLALEPHAVALLLLEPAP